MSSGERWITRGVTVGGVGLMALIFSLFLPPLRPAARETIRNQLLRELPRQTFAPGQPPLENLVPWRQADIAISCTSRRTWDGDEYWQWETDCAANRVTLMTYKEEAILFEPWDWATPFAGPARMSHSRGDFALRPLNAAAQAVVERGGGSTADSPLDRALPIEQWRPILEGAVASVEHVNCQSGSGSLQEFWWTNAGEQPAAVLLADLEKASRVGRALLVKRYRLPLLPWWPPFTFWEGEAEPPYRTTCDSRFARSAMPSRQQCVLDRSLGPAMRTPPEATSR